MKTLVREPLLHFLVVGAALFAVYAWLNRGSSTSDAQTIVVDRGKLLGFIQYRARAFDGERFNAMLDELPREDLERMIKDYVREEALYREAKALQLDKSDYVARLRLIQQLEFITRGFAEQQVHLTQQQIERYYLEHQAKYRVAPSLTFTHVFLSEQRHGAQQAEALARVELSKLNRDHVRFDQAPAHGERFLYQVNYVNREADEIASHFGSQMQAELFALQPSEQFWRGPFRSPYGFHLVLVTGKESAYLPPLEEVRARVERDARQAVLDVRFEQSIQSIVTAYKVQIDRVQPSDRPDHKASS